MVNHPVRMPNTNDYAGPSAEPKKFSFVPAISRVKNKAKKAIELIDPSASAIKKRAYGKSNPTTKEMQDRAYNEATRRWPWIKDEE